METTSAGTDNPKSRPKIGEVLQNMGCLSVVILVVFGMLAAAAYLVFVLPSTVPRAWQTWSRFEPGSLCYVQTPDLALSDPAAESELRQALRVGDFLGVEELIQKGKVVDVEADALVLVLETRLADLGALASELLSTRNRNGAWLKRRVRILAGKDYGRTAWINDRDLASEADHRKTALGAWSPPQPERERSKSPGAPDPKAVEAVLRPLPVEPAVKSAAWQAFFLAESPAEFRRRFDALPLPREAKAQLWDLKFGQEPKARAPAALPPQQ
jgi:hypothetical protein